MNLNQKTNKIVKDSNSTEQANMNAKQFEILSGKKLNLNQKTNKIVKDTKNTEQDNMNAKQFEILTGKKLNLNQKTNKIVKDTKNTEQDNMDSKQIKELTEKLTEINDIIVKYNITEGNLIKEKNELEQQFNNLNVNNQNILNMQAFAKKIINKEHNVKTFFKKIIEKNNVNALIHSPTQVGKTAAAKEFIEHCLNENVPVIVSCDNKSDQLNQFYSRISKDLNNENVTLVKMSDSKYENIIEDCLKNNKKIIMFCLDNASQIKKVKERIALAVLLGNIKLKKIAIIHDEGDVITKDCDIENLNDDQSGSHKQWLMLTQYFSQQEIELKRIFVTATPENVVYKYKIEDVIRLRVPNNYIGYDKIQYVQLDDKIRIKKILIEEQNRRILEKENGVVLYCVDRKIEDGQDETFVSVCSYLECVVNTYNGNGITARVNNEKFEARLEKFVELNNKVKKNKKIVYTDDSTNETKNVWNIKGIAIKDFYQICKEVGSGIIVTIGMDLMARGISFVSSEKAIDTIAATTMIYKPGTTMHAVGLCQTIGRITGTARPDLQRRLYASKNIIEDFIKYNENQKQYLKEIVKNDNIVSSEIMKTIELNKKLTRSIDRKKLGLKPMYKSESESESEGEGEIDGVNLKKLNKLLNDNLLVGRMVRYLYDQETSISLEEFKNGIEYEKSDEEFSSNICNGKAIKSKYGKLWFVRDNTVKLNEKIRNYIKTTL